MIVGLCGGAGSGKTAVAEHIVVSYAYLGVRLLSVADPMKHICRDLFGFTWDQLWGPSHTRMETSPRYPEGPTARQALQLLGTEWGRALHEDVWIDRALIEVIHDMPPQVQLVVIPDIRFDNEAKRLKEAGGEVWRVVRPSPPPLQGGVEDHASEGGLSPHLIDYELTNTGSLEELYKATRKALEERCDVRL